MRRRTAEPIAHKRPLARYQRRPLRTRVQPRRKLMRMGHYQTRARGSLRWYRKASQLAVALVALLLLIWGVPGEAAAEDPAGTTPAGQVTALATADGEDQSATAPADAGDDPAPAEEETSPTVSVQQATGTLRDVLRQAYRLLPKLGIAAAIMLLGWVVSRLAKLAVFGLLRNWDRAGAVSAMSRVVVFLLALGLALTVIAGDSRALVGSVGLAGLALSWALQAPIESFTGWLLNSFQSYYRVGDRILVGDVFGDVYQIDILTTTVWEAGGPDKPVQGAQPTGALITFPNSEVLRNNITNFTRDFPHVWDEVTFSVTNESDLRYSVDVVRRVGLRMLGSVMEGPAREYRRLLQSTKHLGLEIAAEPQVFVSLAESWTNLTVRYLVPARERRKWSSELILAVSAELARPEHSGRIGPAYPRARVELFNAEGFPRAGGAEA